MGGNLTAIVKMPEQALRMKDGRGPTPLMPTSAFSGAGKLVVCSAMSASRSASTALICSSTNSRRSSSREICALMCVGTARPSPVRIPFQTRSPITAQRRIISNAQAKEQSLDPVDVENALGDQHLSFAADPATIFFF